jgi:hypothetical protein
VLSNKFSKWQWHNVGAWGKQLGYGVRGSVDSQEESYGKPPMGIQEKVSLSILHTS